MKSSKVEDRYRGKQRFWQTHIRAWEKSGLSINEYCRRNSLKANQFCYWKKKLSGDNQDTIKFVPIAVEHQKDAEKPEPGDSGVIISFDKISIKLNNDFNPSVLVKAVAVLGGKL